MSPTAAMRQAKSESSMYQQGGQWIVSTYDDSVACRRDRSPQAYFMSREHLAEWRVYRSLLLLGVENDDAFYLATRYSGPWQDRVWLSLRYLENIGSL